MLSLWSPSTRQSLLLGGIMFGPWSGLSLCDGDPLSLAAAALELLLSHEEFSLCSQLNQILESPCSGGGGAAAHVFLVVNILVSKNSGYLINKYFKFALRQCLKSYNTIIQVWTAAPPPPPLSGGWGFRFLATNTVM